ncbi:DUF6268 family outer membrane beta-barrel protein [Saprospiraceae bacterium]|nr:DUF6268 family outer membrane beta-barrel protein [Saprospiraceae bacterium]
MTTDHLFIKFYPVKNLHKIVILGLKTEFFLVSLMALFGTLLQAQTTDFTLAGVEYVSSLESRPYIPPNYSLNGDEKMSANEISAFVNFGYRLSPKTLGFHSLKWSRKDYSALYENGSEYLVPPYLQSIPTLASLDFSSAILHDLSENWALTGLVRGSLTNGSGEYELEGDFNYLGVFLVKRKWNKSQLGVGAFYYRDVANRTYLPLVSIEYNQDRWFVKGTLPLTFVVKYKVYPTISLGLSHEIGSAGYSYNVAENNPQGSWQEPTTLELIKWMVGPTVSWRMTKNFELTAKSGFYNHDFTIQTLEGTAEPLQLKNNFYIALGLNYMISTEGK